MTGIQKGKRDDIHNRGYTWTFERVAQFCKRFETSREDILIYWEMQGLILADDFVTGGRNSFWNRCGLRFSASMGIMSRDRIR